jgi:hypothetical protein
VDADGHYQTPSDAENRVEATLHQTLPVPAAVPDAILSRLEKLEAMARAHQAVLQAMQDSIRAWEQVSAMQAGIMEQLLRACEDRDSCIKTLEPQGCNQVAVKMQAIQQAVAEMDTQPSYLEPLFRQMDRLEARVDHAEALEATVLGLCEWLRYTPDGGEEEVGEVEPAETLEEQAPAPVSDLSATEVAKLLKQHSLEHRMYPNPDGTWRFDTLKTVSRHTGAVHLGVKGKEGRSARDAVAFGLYRLVGELISREQYGECSPADVALLESLRDHQRPSKRLDPVIPISRPPQKRRKREGSSAKYKPTKN